MMKPWSHVPPPPPPQQYLRELSRAYDHPPPVTKSQTTGATPSNTKLARYRVFGFRGMSGRKNAQPEFEDHWAVAGEDGEEI